MCFKNKFGIVVNGSTFTTMKTESVKIPTETVDKIRTHVSTTGQAISWVANIAILEYLKKNKAKK